MSKVLKYASEVLNLEAQELKNAALNLNEDFERVVDLILKCPGKVVVTGVGKSGLVGAKIAATLASTGTPSFFLHPTEALHGDLGMLQKDDIVLAISFSGQSDELLRILPHIRRYGNKIIAMAKSRQTALGALCDEFISINVSKEACPINAAPTSSTTLTLALGDALAVCLMKRRGFGASDFANFHPGGALGKRLFLKVSDVMRRENLPIVSDSVSLKEAINAMTAGKLGSVLLTNTNGELVAVLSDGDLRRALMSESFSLDGKAIEFASLHPKILDDENLLAIDALREIERHKIQLIVVVKNKKSNRRFAYSRPKRTWNLKDKNEN